MRLASAVRRVDPKHEREMRMHMEAYEFAWRTGRTYRDVCGQRWFKNAFAAHVKATAELGNPMLIDK